MGNGGWDGMGWLGKSRDSSLKQQGRAVEARDEEIARQRRLQGLREAARSEQKMGLD
jgi:hypothetical protein